MPDSKTTSRKPVSISRAARQVQSNADHAAAAPPYPRPVVGMASYDIEAAPETFENMVDPLPHRHFTVGAYNVISADGANFEDFTEVDVIATTDAAALAIAKGVIEKRYYRSSRTWVHEPEHQH